MGLFNGIIGNASEVDINKLAQDYDKLLGPSERIEKAYKLMAKRLKVNFDEMIYVGDNEEKDFKGANNLGIITFKIERREGIYKNMKSEKEYIPKYIIKDIKSINELLNKIKFK